MGGFFSTSVRQTPNLEVQASELKPYFELKEETQKLGWTWQLSLASSPGEKVTATV